MLWYAPSFTPYGNEGDTFALAEADTKEEAVEKIRARATTVRGNYVPRQKRIDGIDLSALRPVEEGAFVVCPV